MASFWLTLTFTLGILSPNLVSSLSDENIKKLDEIEKLLMRLQKEIERMRNSDSQNNQKHFSRHGIDDDITNNYNSLTWTKGIQNKPDGNIGNEDVTTRLQHQATQITRDDSKTAISASAAKAYDTTTIAYLNGFPDLEHGTGQQRTTQPQQTEEHNSRFSDTTMKATAKVGEDKKAKDGEKIINENTQRELEMAEEEEKVLETEKVKHLINEGEELERQLKGVFLQLRSLSTCIAVGEKCGIQHGQTTCCKGLKCNAVWNGSCVLDCIPFGENCSENFFCCPGFQCVKPIDRQAYTCQ